MSKKTKGEHTKPRQAGSPATLDRLERDLVAVQAMVARLLRRVRGSERR